MGAGAVGRGGGGGGDEGGTHLSFGVTKLVPRLLIL